MLTREIIAITQISAADTSGVLITFCMYLAVAALVGIAIHYVVEKPLIRIATRLLGLESAKRTIAFKKA